jgi:hypothetical protein
MKKWGIHLELIGHKWIQVEAETKQEASDKAFEIGLNLDFDEFNNDTEVAVVDAVLDEA